MEEWGLFVRKLKPVGPDYDPVVNEIN